MAPKLDCRLESLVSFLKYKFQLKLTEHTHLYVETARVKWCVERVQSVCTCMDNSSEEASKRVFRKRNQRWECQTWNGDTLLFCTIQVLCVCVLLCACIIYLKFYLKKKKNNKLLTPFSKEPDLACLV